MKMDGPSLRRHRDAKKAPASPPTLEAEADPKTNDRQTKLVQTALNSDAKVPELESGRPKDSGRMGA